MTIKEIFKEKRVVSEVKSVKQHSCVRIRFLTSKKKEDETELTVAHNLLTKAGVEELSELFASLTNEFDTTKNDVTAVCIVATANSNAALEAMGY
mgnify:CR=1 FL=1|jgi:hypothetical protein